MESSDITFLNLPYDIIHEICEHLTDKQILKLRFVSKQTSSNIPKSRLDKIFAKRTLRFTDVEATRFLHLLNTNSDEDLARTRHIVFDLSNPYVGLIPSEQFHGGRWRYSEHMKSKMMVFHRIYKERNMREMASGKWKPRDTKRISIPDNLPSPASHPEYCFKELYRIFEEDIECPGRYDQYSYSSSKMINSLLPFNRLAFFDALTAVFRRLPNLSIIEFKISDPPKRPEYRIPEAWIRHNLSLKHFLDKHPESKYLPCGDWFGPLGSMIDLEVAYPAVLYCATQANCRISEIKASQFPKLIVSSFGADIRKFDPFDCGTPTLPSPGSIDSKHLHSYLSDYQRTFATLKRLEIYLARDYCIRDHSGAPMVPSRSFEMTLQNVEEFVIRGSPKLDGHLESQCLPLNIRFPRLRRLETMYVHMELNSLKSLIEPNKSSLKELVSTFSLSENIHYPGIMSFIANIRENFDLTTCNIDFVNSRDYAYHCYTFVKIQASDWKKDEGCRYRAGSLETPGIKIFEKRMRDEVRWKDESDWEDFCGLFEGDNLTQDIGYWDG
ncbi:hypothetical protein TWF679_005432 [Orbilia oligospora]|uniref:F-box domain-containing protein n=1 Tax=Orbilia oligospora TaxID=2813651 RepID=A0A8H8VC34_ORBOL|nr:hypothetical protein TWF679_005432 [Orbilia oligospora]